MRQAAVNCPIALGLCIGLTPVLADLPVVNRMGIMASCFASMTRITAGHSGAQAALPALFRFASRGLWPASNPSGTSREFARRPAFRPKRDAANRRVMILHSELMDRGKLLFDR